MRSSDPGVRKRSNNPTGANGWRPVTQVGLIAARLREACKDAGLDITIIEKKRTNAHISAYMALAQQIERDMRPRKQLEDIW